MVQYSVVTFGLVRVHSFCVYRFGALTRTRHSYCLVTTLCVCVCVCLGLAWMERCETVTAMASPVVLLLSPDDDTHKLVLMTGWCQPANQPSNQPKKTSHQAATQPGTDHRAAHTHTLSLFGYTWAHSNRNGTTHPSEHDGVGVIAIHVQDQPADRI